MPPTTAIPGLSVTVYPRSLRPAPRTPHGQPYRCGAVTTAANYQDGRIDGHCCPYDADVKGRIANSKPLRWIWLCRDCADPRVGGPSAPTPPPYCLTPPDRISDCRFGNQPSMFDCDNQNCCGCCDRGGNCGCDCDACIVHMEQNDRGPKDRQVGG